MRIPVIYQRNHLIDNQIENRPLGIGKIQHKTHIHILIGKPYIFNLPFHISYTIHIIRIQSDNILNRYHGIVIQTDIIDKTTLTSFQKGITSKDTLSRLQIPVRYSILYHPQFLSIIQYKIRSVILRLLFYCSHSYSYCTIGITFVIATS